MALWPSGFQYAYCLWLLVLTRSIAVGVDLVECMSCEACTTFCFSVGAIDDFCDPIDAGMIDALTGGNDTFGNGGNTFLFQSREDVGVGHA
jgi:hypothetical protein